MEIYSAGRAKTNNMGQRLDNNIYYVAITVTSIGHFRR